MTHFSGLVVVPGSVDEAGIEEKLAQILAPWHEFECTGADDQYVVDVDLTEEARAKFAEDTERRLIDPTTGDLVDPYDDRFFRDLTEEEEKNTWFSSLFILRKDWGDGNPHRGRAHNPPEWESTTIPSSTVMTFEKWAEGYYAMQVCTPTDDRFRFGRMEVDAEGKCLRLIDHTNPNKKWDWWVIGGRWEKDIANDKNEAVNFCRAKEFSVQNTMRHSSEYLHNIAEKWLTERKPGVTLRQVNDIRNAAAAVKSEWDLVWEANDKLPKADKKWGPELWGQLPEGHAYRVFFESGANDLFGWLGLNIGDDVPDALAFMDAGRLPFGVFVHGGTWHSRCDYGWWGMTSNEKEEWKDELVGHLEALKTNDPEAWVVLVDFHT